MNAALINTLLSLILMAFKLLYKQERIMDPNAVFQQCYDWFVIKYGLWPKIARPIGWQWPPTGTP